MQNQNNRWVQYSWKRKEQKASTSHHPTGLENLNQELRGNTTGVYDVQISESSRNSFPSLEKWSDTEFFVAENKHGQWWPKNNAMETKVACLAPRCRLSHWGKTKGPRFPPRWSKILTILPADIEWLSNSIECWHQCWHDSENPLAAADESTCTAVDNRIDGCRFLFWDIAMVAVGTYSGRHQVARVFKLKKLMCVSLLFLQQVYNSSNGSWWVLKAKFLALWIFLERSWYQIFRSELNNTWELAPDYSGYLTNGNDSCLFESFKNSVKCVAMTF
jgi:hypothetical protein